MKMFTRETLLMVSYQVKERAHGRMVNATQATLRKERFRGLVPVNGLTGEYTLENGQTQTRMAREG